MNRRQYLAALGSASALATAGCATPRSSRTLTDPEVHADAPHRKWLAWTEDGESLAELGVTGTVGPGLVALDTEIPHRDGTQITEIALRVAMPPAAVDAATDVAVVSPVQGDSSPPPSLSLHSPDRSLGTVVEVTDLDDLADETISTLDLLVKPGTATATTIVIEGTLGLSTGGWTGQDYTLQGQLRMTVPEGTDSEHST